jgi:hypothetical protein
VLRRLDVIDAVSQIPLSPARTSRSITTARKRFLFDADGDAPSGGGSGLLSGIRLSDRASASPRVGVSQRLGSPVSARPPRRPTDTPALPHASESAPPAPHESISVTMPSTMSPSRGSSPVNRGGSPGGRRAESPSELRGTPPPFVTAPVIVVQDPPAVFGDRSVSSLGSISSTATGTVVRSVAAANTLLSPVNPQPISTKMHDPEHALALTNPPISLPGA